MSGAFTGTAAVCDGEAADEAIDRRAHRKLVDAPLRVVEREALALKLAFFRAKLEHDVFAFELSGLGGVLAANLGRAQRILGLHEIVLRDHAGDARLLDALVHALRRNALDLGSVCVALREEPLLPCDDPGAAKLGFHLSEDRLFALELIREVGRVDIGHHVATLDGIACADFQRDGAARRREERRAHRRDDAAVDVCIAHQRAARDCGDAQPRRAYGLRGVLPGPGKDADGAQRRDRDTAPQERARESATWLLRDGNVLAGGIGDHRPCTARRVPIGDLC